MKYVIIGGDAAGMSAAMQVFKHDETAQITILEQGEIYSYAQCGIPYAVSGVTSSVENLLVRSVATFRNKFGMDARINYKVEKVDTNKQIVSGRHLKTGEAFQVPYDKLLIASGASPFVPQWEGINLAGIHSVKTLPDTNRIIEDLEEDVAEVTIVGGGYISLEMAESFRVLGKKVRLLIRGTQIAKIFDEDMAKLVEEEAVRQEIEILYEEEIEEIIGDGKVSEVRTNKQTHKTDLLIVATGVRPNTAFLKETNISLAKNGAVDVNEHLETNVPNVYAAGDCALQYNRLTGKNDYIPLGTHANKQGRIAGLNMAGMTRSFKGIVGTSILKFMDLSLGKTGLSEREAKDAEIPCMAVLIKAKDHAAYYPQAETLWIKLTFNENDGLLLGGQVIGKAGVDKRTDVVAVAIFNQMTVEELEDLDLGYAPPYNSTWDPIQKAARKAVGKLTEDQ